MNAITTPTALRPPEDTASRRQRAVAAFIATARRLLPDPANAGAEPLRVIAAALEALALRAELFPASHFPVSAQNPAQVYRLAEDRDGHFALYVSAGLPGKSQPPHDHTTWAVIAGIRGNERNVFYRRERTADPAHDQSHHGEADRRDSLPAQIAALPLDEREILLVIALAQVGYEAAARILEVPFSTVVSRLMRARARLDATHSGPANRIAHLRLVK